MTQKHSLDRRFRPIVAGTLSLAIAVLSGCSRSDSDGVNTQSQPGDSAAVEQPKTAPVIADNDEDVEALEEAGFVLEKNKAGNVVELSVSSDVSIAESLKHLRGLPSVEVAIFNGPGVDDEGMQAIESLSKLKRLTLTDSSKRYFCVVPE